MTEITEESLSVVLQPLLEGLGRAVGTTLFASVTAYAIGLFLGIVLLVARTSGGKPLAALVAVYVSFMRGTPLLVQLLIAFYVIPSLINIQFSPLAAGILALALNTTAYISEILRGALSTLPRGQRSAGMALGMRPAQVWRHILLPQVFHRSLPPLKNEFTVILKASSLLSLIAVEELSTQARNATLQTDLPLQVFMVTAIIYFVILWTGSSISRLIEHRIAKLLPHVN